MTIERPAQLAVLPKGYGPLFDNAAEQFWNDERVRGMWIHGALARDGGDAGSDLDIDVAVRDDDFDTFTAGWREWLATITPTVSALPIGTMPGSFYALTPTCERLDVVCEKASGTASSFLTRRIVVFDRDGLTATIPPTQDPPPNPGAIQWIIEDTLRQSANFPVVVVRQDWLMGVIAVETVQLALYQLFAESNKPQAPTGPKQWSHKLTAEHRRMLEELPVPQANADSVYAARQATVSLFLREAPVIAAANNVSWPTPLADAVLRYLQREGVGIDTD